MEVLKIASLILLLVWTLGMKAQGNIPDSIAPSSSSITQEVYRIDEVEVVKARSISPIEATVPVQLIGHEQMLRLGMESITDALKHVAGITVRDYGGAGGMKTVSVRGLGARHTAVVYDGIALSDCQTGEIDLSRYSLDQMERLALIVGDGDDIFVPARNSSTAATLYLESRGENPLHSPLSTFNSQLSIGSWGTVNPSVYYGKTVSEKLFFSTIGEYLYAENDYPFTLTNVRTKTRERRNNSRMSAAHVELNGTWQMDSRNILKGKVYYYDNDRQLPGIVRYYTNENDETLHDQNAFGQLQYKGRYTEKWSFMINGKYNWSRTVYHNGSPSAGITSGKYLQNEIYGSLALMYSPLTWLAFDYSADYIRNTIQTPVDPVRHSILQSFAAKMNTRRFTVIAKMLGSIYINKERHGSGEAAERDKEGNEHRFSPSLSASSRLLSHQDLYVRAMWKSIFRMPTFNEIYFNHIGTVALKPENTHQLNIGITWSSPQQLSPVTLQLTADGYINKVTDKIVAIPYNMFVWRMMNVAKTTAYGIDVTADAQWQIQKLHRLGLTGNYSWQRVENRTNPQSPYYHNQIAYTPEHSFSATVTWENPWANLAVTGDGMNERWTTNEHHNGTRIAGFMEMDASVYRTFQVGKMMLTTKASVRNLFDKQYDIVAHYPMPGRSWRISLIISN